MATGLQRNKHINRPRKSESDKRRRRKVQIKRMVKLGVPEASLTKLNSKELRGVLRHPVKAAKAAAATKAAKAKKA